MSNSYGGYRDMGRTHGMQRELRPARLTKEEEVLVHRGNRLAEEFRIEGKATVIRYVCDLPGWPQAHLIVCRYVRPDNWGNDSDYASYQSKLYTEEDQAAEVFRTIVSLITDSILNPAEGKDDMMRADIDRLMRHYTMEAEL